MRTPRLYLSHVAASGLLAGAILVACGSKEDAPPPEDPPVTQGQYCQRTGAAMCTCVGVPGAAPACMEGYSMACLAGKDPNALVSTESQTQLCEAALSQKCTSAVMGQVPECPGLTFPIPALPGMMMPAQ